MDCRDESTESPRLSMKNLKDNELEHEYERPLLCTKLYLEKSTYQFLQIFAFVYPTLASALAVFVFLHDSSIIMQKKIVISYSPSFKQTHSSGLSCLITWAYYLVFLFSITNLCDVDDENMRGWCAIMEPENYYVSLLLSFCLGILPLMLSDIRLTSRCNEAEWELLRNVNTETDKLVLCKKRSEIKKDERTDSIDVLVYIEKRCNAKRTKLRKDQQTKDVKEESIDDVESDQTNINGQNEQLEASTQINETVEHELRGLQSKYYGLQMKYI
ncbi:hypothetical protein WN944_006953 [Citrus x changshan-huyou]|uniref:Uncharacterized protein n=1 Tax=Citrus x changshan-huyou TaxID=2935761 RepID=A0AAP0QTR1_9ROSI